MVWEVGVAGEWSAWQVSDQSVPYPHRPDPWGSTGPPASGYAGFDSDGDYLETSDSSNDRSEDIGTGIPSDPIVVLEGNKAHVVVGTTDGTIEQLEVPLSVGLRILYWREVLD